MPDARDREGYAAEVLAVLEEGQAAQAAATAAGVPLKKWQLPSAALMALQKNGCGLVPLWSSCSLCCIPFRVVAVRLVRCRVRWQTWVPGAAMLITTAVTGQDAGSCAHGAVSRAAACVTRHRCADTCGHMHARAGTMRRR